jgi:hypothetical protein
MPNTFDRIKTLYDDFKSRMLIASVIIALITTGIQAAVLTLIAEHVDWSNLGLLFITTAPLTLAFALTAAMAWPTWSGGIPSSNV